MRLENKEKLYGHLCFKTKLWLNCQGKKILDENGKDKYLFKYKYSSERVYQYCHKKISNIEELVYSDDELYKLIDRAYKFCTNDEDYKEWKKTYDYKRYHEKIKTGLEKSRAEINKERQAIKRANSKNLVLKIINNLKKNNKKITSNSIYEVMQGLDNGLGLTQCKKYLKELKDENQL